MNCSWISVKMSKSHTTVMYLDARKGDREKRVANIFC